MVAIGKEVGRVCGELFLAGFDFEHDVERRHLLVVERRDGERDAENDDAVNQSGDEQRRAESVVGWRRWRERRHGSRTPSELPELYARQRALAESLRSMAAISLAAISMLNCRS